jgi:hypothetical protein
MVNGDFMTPIIRIAHVAHIGAIGPRDRLC